MFAPPICRRRWRNNAFSFRQLRRRRRQPSEYRSERSEQSNTARLREQLIKIARAAHKNGSRLLMLIMLDAASTSAKTPTMTDKMT